MGFEGADGQAAVGGHGHDAVIEALACRDGAHVAGRHRQQRGEIPGAHLGGHDRGDVAGGKSGAETLPIFGRELLHQAWPFGEEEEAGVFGDVAAKGLFLFRAGLDQKLGGAGEEGGEGADHPVVPGVGEVIGAKKGQPVGAAGGLPEVAAGEGLAVGGGGEAGRFVGREGIEEVLPGATGLSRAGQQGQQRQ